MNLDTNIPLSEYQARREAVLKSLGSAVGLVFAGEPHGHEAFRPDSSFYYLTGIADEPGAMVWFDGKAEDPRRSIMLFLKPRDPELEQWDGLRDPIDTSLRAATGFSWIMRSTYLPRTLTTAARRAGKMACLHPFAAHTANPTPDLALFRKVTERTVGVSIEDRTTLIASMRAAKSASERALIQRAIDATLTGIDALLAAMAPGRNEKDLERAFVMAITGAGASGNAYDPIVGAGLRGTVLHYRANNAVCEDGDLIVLDAAARVGNYNADITRTYPVSGTFSKRQREIYSIVLEAQEAAIAAVKPGATNAQIDIAARTVIEKAGYGDYYIHGIGHHLGLDVHDIDPGGPLQPGAIMTIEPGIYLPHEQLGVRIEDDVLVTAKGRENLSAHIPKSIEEVEAQIARLRGGSGGGRSVKPTATAPSRKRSR
jgi:Xaa-Pro aminopeptidase